MKISFTYLPGDGIGPEVGACALAVLETVAQIHGHNLEIDTQLIGGAAIDAGLGPLPEASLKACQNTQVILLGAVGGPKWDHLTGTDRPELGALLTLRKTLNLYANIRPICPFPALIERAPLKAERLVNVDFIIVRELTGGIYFGRKGRDAQSAFDECRYTETEIQRITRKAFEIAAIRKGKLTSVDKSNVLETSRLWRDVVKTVARDYPQITLEHVLVDAMSMHMLTRAQEYDVILTENMFGDILTDEASVLCGSMGVIPSASLSDDQVGLYEPIHGSAPDIAGQNKANPLAMILSAALMLRLSFGLETEATLIEKAVSAILTQKNLTPDLGGSSTTQQIGHKICTWMRNHVD